MLIQCYTKAGFTHPKLMLKNRLLYCTKGYIHHLLTYLAFLLNKGIFIENAAGSSPPRQLVGIINVYCSATAFSCLSPGLQNNSLLKQKSYGSIALAEGNKLG